MKYAVTFLLLLFCSQFCHSQDTYTDSLKSFRQHYIDKHGVVKGKDKENLRFFPVDPQYAVAAVFQRLEEADWFPMETSGSKKKLYRVYGRLEFKIHDTTCRLYVYQSKDLLAIPDYADLLFLPFTDKTCGVESYDNGRYIDLREKQLESGHYRIDFNKAYNPYCAYVSGVYNCPVPPRENDLPVAVRAGEMNYPVGH